MKVIIRVDKKKDEYVCFLPEKRVKYSGNIQCMKENGEIEEVSLRYYVIGTKVGYLCDVSLEFNAEINRVCDGEVEIEEQLTAELKDKLLTELCDIKYPV